MPRKTLTFFLLSLLSLNAATFEKYEDVPTKSLVVSASSDGQSLYLTNEIVGATSFYENGVYGRNAAVANVELGVYWPNHDVFADATIGTVFLPSGVEASALYSDHATATAGVIAGYNSDQSAEVPYYAAFGIAPLATLSAGAVAREITADGKANIEAADFCAAYKNFFQTTPQDVINSSWGPDSTEPNSYFAHYVDALSFANTHTTLVIAAGNSGYDENGNATVTNSVSSFAQAYNAISVGASGNPPVYDQIADFSSRSPSDFYNPVTGETVANVRPAVDITAPGVNVGGAYYDAANPDATNNYLAFSGTSFSAPIVSGTVALMASLSKDLEANASFVAAGWSKKARDSRVIKAVLMNSASKPSGWTNNQSLQNGVEFKIDVQTGVYYTSSFDNVVVTTQGLDYTYGAGMLNASAALDQYVGMYTTGTADNVWILDEVDFNASKLYHIGEISEGKSLNMTLVWMTESQLAEPAASGEFEDIANFNFANLTLELWTKGEDGNFTPIAISNAVYNNVEHLSITLASLADYYVRVAFFEMLYGEKTSETYALAWAIVPEPSSFGAIFGFFVLIFVARKRK